MPRTRADQGFRHLWVPAGEALVCARCAWVKARAAGTGVRYWPSAVALAARQLAASQGRTPTCKPQGPPALGLAGMVPPDAALRRL